MRRSVYREIFVHRLPPKFLRICISRTGHRSRYWRLIIDWRILIIGVSRWKTVTIKTKKGFFRRHKLHLQIESRGDHVIICSPDTIIDSS